MKVLYVEDDAEAREFVQKALEQQGFTVDTAGDLETGFARAVDKQYELAIIDVMLPDGSGFDLLRRLRERDIETPAIFLTALGDVGRRVEGLNLGADDYLAKPFALAELVARVKAITRRSVRVPPDGRFEVADLVLDMRRRCVERAGRRIELTPKEFSLLEYLITNSEHVVSRSMLTERVWGYGLDTHNNVIDVHVNRLRNKMDRGFSCQLIHTVKGVGYVLEDRSVHSVSD